MPTQVPLDVYVAQEIAKATARWKRDILGYLLADLTPTEKVEIHNLIVPAATLVGPSPIDPTPATAPYQPNQSTGALGDIIRNPGIEIPVLALRTSPFPTSLLSQQNPVDVAADLALMDVYQVPAPGVITVSGTLDAAGTPAQLQATGDDGNNWWYPSGSGYLAPGSRFNVPIQVNKGDQFNLRFAQTTRVASLSIVFQNAALVVQTQTQTTGLTYRDPKSQTFTGESVSAANNITLKRPSSVVQIWNRDTTNTLYVNFPKVTGGAVASGVATDLEIVSSAFWQGGITVTEISFYGATTYQLEVWS